MEAIEKVQGVSEFKNQYLFVIPAETVGSFEGDPLLSPFYISDIGYYPNALNHYRKRKTGSQQGILLFCVAGSGYYRIDGGERVELKAGQAVSLPPHVCHEYAADGANPWSVYWLHYAGCAMEDVAGALLRWQRVQIKDSYFEEMVDLFQNCFKILKGPCQEEEYQLVFRYASTILSLVNLSGKHAQAHLTPKGDRAIQNAVAFMKMNMDRPLTLAELSAEVHFSPSHLHALFKASTGHAPMDYYLQMKMQAASKELYFSDLSIKEVAGRYGIYDASYFSRLFKRVMGVSPAKYRNLTRG